MVCRHAAAGRTGRWPKTSISPGAFTAPDTAFAFNQRRSAIHSNRTTFTSCANSFAAGRTGSSRTSACIGAASSRTTSCVRSWPSRFWDALFASLAFLVVLPVLIVLCSYWFALGYILDAPVVPVPVALTAARRRELGRALLSFPCFYALRFVNAATMLQAAFRELIARKPLLVYEKGH